MQPTLEVTLLIALGGAQMTQDTHYANNSVLYYSILHSEEISFEY
jgi:hypothetical protein